jgi:hypothetical protein
LKVGISYPQYSRYEAGDQLPNLEQALELCRLLSVPALEGLMEWNRAQMAGEIAQAALRDIESLLERIRVGGIDSALAPPPAPTQASSSPVMPAAPRPDGLAQKVTGIGVFTHATISLDDIIVFNRSHLKLFSSDPNYRDIFTYINSYAPEWIAGEEIAQALDLEQAVLDEMLEKLNDLGVILLAGGRCRASKRNFYFPDDPDFFHLRNLNLTHNATGIMRKLSHDDLVGRKAYRGLITRELTAEQLDLVITRIDELTSGVVGLPETSNPERIYSLCVLLGERYSRPSVALSAQPGLRRGLTTEPRADEVSL